MTETFRAAYLTKDTGLSILVADPGGRGHAMVWELSRSDRVASVHTCIAGADVGPSRAEIVYYRYNRKDPTNQAVRLAQDHGVDLVVPLPERLLSDGVANILSTLDIPAFGPHQELAFLEADKGQAKQFMSRHNIPIPGFGVFTDFNRARRYIEAQKHPLVVKAAGLAAGKGSIVCDDCEQAIRVAKQMIEEESFGKAGKKIVVEKRLFGIEQSVMIVSDGESVALLPTARDYKQRLDGNKGANTGGMGSHSPSGNEDIFDEQKVLEKIIIPALEGVRNETNIPYKGVLYAGLMWVCEDGKWDPYVLEFNIRPGDPEWQVVAPRLDGDWAEILVAAVNGRLGELNPSWSDTNYLTVCAVSGEVTGSDKGGKGRYSGYPGRYKTNRKVSLDGSEYPDAVSYMLHSGTKWACLCEDVDHHTPRGCPNGFFATIGGRVLSPVGVGANLSEAAEHAYQELVRAKFAGMDYRGDIGNPSLLAQERARR